MIGIVGAGPAGLACGYTLLENGRDDFIIYDFQPLKDRKCYFLEQGDCLSCNTCSILYGVGGAGTFSDAKIVGDRRELETTIAPFLSKFIDVPPMHTGTNIGLDMEAFGVELDTSYNTTIHLGSNGGRELVERMAGALDGHFSYYETLKRYDCSTTILATGRPSYGFVKNIYEIYEVEYKSLPVDIGVRVEVPAEYLDPIKERGFYDFKLHARSSLYNDKIRTFCVCHNGFIVIENHKIKSGPFTNVMVPNGAAINGSPTDRSNFAVLCSIELTDPVVDGAQYPANIMNISHLLGRGVIFQKFIDLLEGRRSKKLPLYLSDRTFYPGDLGLAMPYRYLDGIKDFLLYLQIMLDIDYEMIDLYGIETKFYPVVPKHKNPGGRILDSKEELYVIGDASGTRGIAKAIESGIRCAKEILDG